jgi:HECT-like Ubiquitin-conjugating enzyme (E2)-binding
MPSDFVTSVDVVEFEYENLYFYVIIGDERRWSIRLAKNSRLIEYCGAANIGKYLVFKFEFESLSMHEIYEQWPSQLKRPLICEKCDNVLLNGGQCLLLPSSTWGAEDLRACEECHPFDAPHTNKVCKINDDRLFINDKSIFTQTYNLANFEMQRDQIICSSCHSVIGRQLHTAPNALSELKVGSGKCKTSAGSFVEINKNHVFCEQVLQLINHHPVASVGSIIENEMKRFFNIKSPSGNSCRLKLIGGPVHTRTLKDERLLNGLSEVPVRALKVLVCEGVEIAGGAEIEVSDEQMDSLLEYIEKSGYMRDFWPEDDDFRFLYLPTIPELED